MGPTPRSDAIVPLCLFIALAACAPDTSSPGSAEQRTVSLPFDKRSAQGPEAPHLEGASGILRYKDGCLFLESGEILTGLVLPDAYSFDGVTLQSPLRSAKIGERVQFSGGFAKENGPYRCAAQMPTVLIADYVPAPRAS